MSRARNKSKSISTTKDLSDVVDVFEDRYYNLNKRLLCYVGLWPCQSLYQRSARSAFLIFLSISLLVPQMLELVQAWGDTPSFIECFSPVVTNLGAHLKVYTCIIYNEKLKSLLDVIQSDWASTRNSEELKILREHGRTGRRVTIAYLITVYGAITAWTSVPLIPIVMDMVIPLNESRPHIQYFATDYRVDPDKYFYPIFLHATVVVYMCGFVYVGLDTTLMTFAEHISAMIGILRYRLENMVQEDPGISNRRNTDIQDKVYYQQIAECIKNHKRYIEFIRIMQSACQWYLLICIGMNMLVISVTCSQIVSKNTSTEDSLRFTFFTAAQVVHLYMASLPGQTIMQASLSVPFSSYSCKWYLMSPRTQKLFVLFIRRSTQPCVITAGKMYVMSMENFCCVLQTSMSYVTLLTSMQ